MLFILSLTVIISSTAYAADTQTSKATHALRLALHNIIEGHKIKPSTLTHVLYSPGEYESIYLITKSHTIYSFSFSDGKAQFSWGAHLVPSSNADAYPPSGALSIYLEAQGSRVPSETFIAKMGVPGPQPDLESLAPLQTYKVLRNGALIPEPLPPLLTPSGSVKRATQLLDLALNSEAGKSVKRADVTVVLKRLEEWGSFALVTNTNQIYFFRVDGSTISLLWQSALLPSTSPDTYGIKGALGAYFEKQGKRIAKVYATKNNANWWARDEIEASIPFIAYKLQQDGTVIPIIEQKK